MGADGHKRVECECGQRLKIPDDGREHRVRCPKCRRVFTCPPQAHQAAARSGAPAARSRANPAASDREARDRDAPVHGVAAHGADDPAAAVVRVRCRCGKKIGVPGAAAGRRVRCPRCRAAVAIPILEPDPGAADDPAALDDDLYGLADGAAVNDYPRPSPPAGGNDGGRLAGPGDDDLRLLPPVELPPEPAAPRGEPKTCPCCARSLPPTAVICTDCGIDVKTGRALRMVDDDHLDRVYMTAQSVIWWLSWLIWLGIYPLTSEGFGVRKPWVVRGIALLTIGVSLWYMVAFLYNDNPDPDLARLMLWGGDPQALHALVADEIAALRDEGWTEAEIQAELATLPRYEPRQLLTHVLLHADPLHLAGNMLFLIVLGARVNALIGNALTLVLYPLLGIAAALAQMAASAHEPLHPGLGASGAVMGLAGMYLVLFPVHKVHMAVWWRWGLIALFRLHLKMFALRGFWVVLFYIAFDVLYTAFGWEDDVAHWAHLGGFIVGVAVALLLLVMRLANARGGDLLSVMLGPRAWPLIGRPNRPGLTLW